MTAIASEIERFNRLSATWWDTRGPMRPLHVVNALRRELIVERIKDHFELDPSASSLGDLRILDVGCGGGLLAEPLAQMGAQVVGVDASPGNVAAARLHAEQAGVQLDYRLGEPNDVLAPGEQFDIVMALEVVEHVRDMPIFVNAAARCVAPGGLLFASTIDRTLKSFVFAIVGAEYVLRVLPRGTHRWRQFVRPKELADAAARSGLRLLSTQGMQYNPLRHTASWCQSTDVNYLSVFEIPR